MLPLDNLIGFIGASLLLALVPGPDNLYVLSQSLVRGRWAGMSITLGLCTGLILHTTLVVLGLAVAIQASVLVFTLLKLLGAGYLLYLAWHFFKAAPLAQGGAGSGTMTTSQLYRRGVIMNISNPKVSLFFLAFLPQFAEPATGHLTFQLILLGGLFLLSTLLVFGGIALLAAYAGNWWVRSARAQTLLNRLAGSLFVVLAVRLVMTER